MITSERIEAGGRVTVVIWADPENLNGAPDGGMGAWVAMHREKGTSPTVQGAPEGQALLIADFRELEHTEGLADYWYLKVDGSEGCLEGRFTDPDFPFAQPQVTAPGSLSELVVPPGGHQLTLHADDPAIVPFDCSSEPLFPPVPLDVAAGDRAYLFAFAPLGSTEVQTLLVPIDP